LADAFWGWIVATLCNVIFTLTNNLRQLQLVNFGTVSLTLCGFYEKIGYLSGGE